MGIGLTVRFGYYNEDSKYFSQMSKIDMDKALSDLYEDETIFSIGKSDRIVKMMNLREVNTNGYGDQYTVIKAKELSEFLYRNRDGLLIQHSCINTGMYYRAWFDERVQCLIAMLKTLPEMDIIMEWW